MSIYSWIFVSRFFFSWFFFTKTWLHFFETWTFLLFWVIFLLIKPVLHPDVFWAYLFLKVSELMVLIPKTTPPMVWAEGPKNYIFDALRKGCLCLLKRFLFLCILRLLNLVFNFYFWGKMFLSDHIV